ncbi:MAG: hypothetical protein KDK48_01200 [Chlamydiia bacterium]|nr:hypothetical protein [Chlamydiia bacterium]
MITLRRCFATGRRDLLQPAFDSIKGRYRQVRFGGDKALLVRMRDTFQTARAGSYGEAVQSLEPHCEFSNGAEGGNDAEFEKLYRDEKFLELVLKAEDEGVYTPKQFALYGDAHLRSGLTNPFIAEVIADFRSVPLLGAKAARYRCNLLLNLRLLDRFGTYNKFDVERARALYSIEQIASRTFLERQIKAESERVSALLTKALEETNSPALEEMKRQIESEDPYSAPESELDPLLHFPLL